MTTFTDSRGTEWTLSLTSGDLKRIRKTVGLDLAEALKPGLGELGVILDEKGDRFLELMWALCGRDAKIPRDEFECLFDRDTAVGAVAAVTGEVFDFFRGEKIGQAVRRRILGAVEEADRAGAAFVDRMKIPTPRVVPTSNGSVSASGESSASTTDPSPSAS